MQLTGSSFKMCRKRYMLVAAAICAFFVFNEFVNIRDLFLAASQTLAPRVRSSLTTLTASTTDTADTAAAEATEDYLPQAMVQTPQADAVYVQRRQESQAWCGQGGQRGNVSRWTRYNQTAYCVLPKVGCTFWKNVFRYLHGDTGGSYPSPFHIPKIYTHTGPMKRMRLYRAQDQGYLKDDFRFLFVRDPYSRLYSAYVDKLLLPDFWRVLGVPIAKLRVNESNIRCGSDISFQEFLDFVVSQRPIRFSNHWKPAYKLCNPCLFQPHVIGKMETFAQDVKYILRFMNSSWMLKYYGLHQHVLQEVEMVTQYNFAIWRKRKHVHKCVSHLHLCHLLWKAFQINGYLPSGKPFPMHLMHRMNSEEQFVSLVQEMHEEETAKNGSSQWHQQKEDTMLEAYREIRPDTLDKLKEIYKYDFLMFQYDPEPGNIFQHRKRLERII